MKNFNLDILPGEKVGIVGSNGSGKTTIIKLLCGLCVPEKGNIYIDNIDINKYDLDLLKKQFGFTLQKEYLVSGRLSEILSFGLEDAYLDNKNKLIKVFQLNLNKFKDGWETFINENSINISGGEMQKISLIRMFSSTKTIYILDEPTSFMDIESERKICVEMKKLLIDRTAIIITHRQQILSICNRIIDLDKLK
ncbi:MAG: ATP-binding cassette domain-containing protein [Clostridiaceae bacterium]|nr:ATP-binding cassette domain-containing protein [Clostridiaceae bacterium]